MQSSAGVRHRMRATTTGRSVSPRFTRQPPRLHVAPANLSKTAATQCRVTRPNPRPRTLRLPPPSATGRHASHVDARVGNSVAGQIESGISQAAR